LKVQAQILHGNWVHRALMFDKMGDDDAENIAQPTSFCYRRI